MKVCTKCGLPWPVAQFSKRATARDGLKPECKACDKLSMTKYRAANPEKSKAATLKWRVDHSDQVKASARKYYADNVEKFRARKTGWRIANPEKAKVIMAKSIAKNPEAHRANTAKWRADNPEKGQAQVHRRRVRIAGGIVENFPHSEIYERDGWICQLCDEPIEVWVGHGPKSPWRASPDHLVPVSLGGHHIRENVQASHLRCNLRKGNRAAPWLALA